MNSLKDCIKRNLCFVQSLENLFLAYGALDTCNDCDFEVFNQLLQSKRDARSQNQSVSLFVAELILQLRLEGKKSAKNTIKSDYKDVK